MSAFSVERRGGVAIVTFDTPNETVNKISKAVGWEFEDLLGRLAADEPVKAIVLRSGKPDTFIAGADIEEFVALRSVEEAQRLSRDGQLLMQKVADSPKPIVAAIHGAADKPEAALRSGGYVMESFELALAMLARTDTYRDGLVAAVNMGHDADTSGAIYGQLAGAIYGASAIPAAWLDRLAWRDRLEALIDGLWLLAGGDRVD